jgi:hypothetical protein
MIANSLGNAPHTAYSLDLAPSNFWLFEYLNDNLREMEFDEPQQLLSAILEILTELTVETLNQVFEEWMRWLQ